MVLLLAACQEGINQNACEYNDPLKEIPWLKDIVAQFEEAEGQGPKKKIVLYEYNGGDIFMVSGCYDCADELYMFYDCEGNEFCKSGGIAGFHTCPETGMREVKVLYESE